MPPSWARVHSYNGQNRNFYFKVKVEFEVSFMVPFEIALSLVYEFICRTGLIVVLPCICSNVH